MKNIIKLFILYLSCMCFKVNAQAPGTPYILPGASSCLTTTSTYGTCSITVKGCGCVTGATKNDSLNTFGIEYDWTGGVGWLPNNVTHQALVEINGQCWYRYNAKFAWGGTSTVTFSAGATDIGARTLTPGGPYYYEGFLYQRSHPQWAICPTGFRKAEKADWNYLFYGLTSWCGYQCNVNGGVGVPVDDSLIAMLTPTWVNPTVRKSGLNLYGGGHYCNSCGYWNYGLMLYDYTDGLNGYINLYGFTQSSVGRTGTSGIMSPFQPSCNGGQLSTNVGMTVQLSSPEPEEACTVRCVAN